MRSCCCCMTQIQPRIYCGGLTRCKPPIYSGGWCTQSLLLAVQRSCRHTRCVLRHAQVWDQGGLLGVGGEGVWQLVQGRLSLEPHQLSWVLRGQLLAVWGWCLDPVCRSWGRGVGVSCLLSAKPDWHGLSLTTGLALCVACVATEATVAWFACFAACVCSNPGLAVCWSTAVLAVAWKHPGETKPGNMLPLLLSFCCCCAEELAATPSILAVVTCCCVVPLPTRSSCTSFDVEFELACVRVRVATARCCASARVKRRSRWLAPPQTACTADSRGVGCSQLGGGGSHLLVGVYRACKACTETGCKAPCCCCVGLVCCVARLLWSHHSSVTGPRRVLLPHWPLNRPCRSVRVRDVCRLC